MHLDDSYVKLATAVLQFGAAYFALRQISLQKKPNSVPRGIRNPLKKKVNRLTHLSVANLFSKKSESRYQDLETVSLAALLHDLGHSAFLKKSKVL
jgi:hypothetical protein